VLSELLSTGSEGDGPDGRHRDGGTTDEKDKDIVEAIAVRIVVRRVQDENLENDEDANGDQTGRADLGENRLQVASRVIILAEQQRNTSKKGVGTRRDNNTLCFTLLASRAAEIQRSDLCREMYQSRSTHEKHWSPVFLL